MNICFASIKKINTLLRKKKISVYELTNEFLENIKKNNSKVNALIYINEKNALKKSKFIDYLIAKRKLKLKAWLEYQLLIRIHLKQKVCLLPLGQKNF